MRGHLLPLLALAAWSWGTPALAQDDSRVATLGRLLEAEDRRAYQPGLFEAAMRTGDPIVRRQATLGAGRIRDPRAGGPLLALLESADTTAHGDAMFALGMLGDSTVTGAIIARLADGRPLADRAAIEAPSTLAKLGGGEARTLFSRLLDGTSGAVTPDRRRLMLPGLLVEGWRFGRHAPVRAALMHLRDSSDAVRWRAAYLLGRTRASVGARALLAASTDRHPWVRQNVMRGLTRTATDSAGVPRDSVVPVLLRGLTDGDAGTRVNALLSLVTWSDSALASRVVPLLRDPVSNVRLQALLTLAGLPGEAARLAVAGVARDPREPLALRREALLAGLRSDTSTAVARATELLTARDPRLRQLALELATASRATSVPAFRVLLHDADATVRAAAIGALGLPASGIEAEVAMMADSLRHDPDPRLRAAAWSLFGRRAAGPEAVTSLVTGFTTELARGRRGATGPILSALRRIYEAGGEGRAAVESRFLATTTPPPDYLLRRAASNWPAVAAKWGDVYPAEVRYSAAEYQALAARWLLDSATARPRVWLDTEGRGRIEIELLGDHAPLTVANFLSLVDQAAFDGGEWHRVIPNFVVQDGAGPRANPIGGLAPIRDEFNPLRYDVPVLGMALSGPDTGTSQWFINLSPQPHLDGGYTVFGRVVGGTAALEAILQGDSIRSIRRR